jgi:hypothetical protein
VFICFVLHAVVARLHSPATWEPYVKDGIGG